MFLDADDLFPTDYIGKMVSAIEDNNTDMAVCQFFQYDFKTNRILNYMGYNCILMPQNKAIQISSIPNLLSSISPVPHNKIIRKDIIEKNKLSFSNTISANDVYFFHAALLCSKTIVLVDKHLYTYCQNRNPFAISNSRGKNIKDLAVVSHQIYQWMKGRGIEDRYCRDFCIRHGKSYHLYARECTSAEEFSSIFVHYLVNEEPWKNMTDKELFQKAHLSSGKAKLKLDWIRMKIKFCPKSSPKYNLYSIQRDSAAREVQNCGAVRKALSIKYHKKTDIKDCYLTERILQIREMGIIDSFQIINRKIRQKLFSITNNILHKKTDSII